MNKPIIYGAFDRHNYGDLLFAVVLHSFIERNYGVQPIIASMKSSNMSIYGGLDTVPLGSVIKKDEFIDNSSIIIVAGGEVMTAQWASIIAYLMPQLLYYPFRVAFKIMGKRLTNFIAIKLTGIPSQLPFMLSAAKLNKKVCFNSVGGSSINKQDKFTTEEIRKSCSQASFVTVRDELTLDSLKTIGVDGDLAPDCAILISKLFSSSHLTNSYSTVNKEKIIKGNYFIFQISDHYSKGVIEVLVKELKIIIEFTGLRVCLLSIGKASGHSDDIPLNKIHHELGGKSFFINSGNIYEIMHAISCSKLYIGTSLHGAITAMAYLIPHIALFPNKILKLSSFLKTWSLASFYRCSEIKSLSFNAGDLLLYRSNGNRLEYLNHIENLQDRSSKSLHGILKC